MADRWASTTPEQRQAHTEPARTVAVQNAAKRAAADPVKLERALRIARAGIDQGLATPDLTPVPADGGE